MASVPISETIHFHYAMIRDELAVVKSKIAGFSDSERSTIINRVQEISVKALSVSKDDFIRKTSPALISYLEKSFKALDLEFQKALRALEGTPTTKIVDDLSLRISELQTSITSFKNLTNNAWIAVRAFEAVQASGIFFPLLRSGQLPSRSRGAAAPPAPSRVPPSSSELVLPRSARAVVPSRSHSAQPIHFLSDFYDPCTSSPAAPAASGVSIGVLRIPKDTFHDPFCDLIDCVNRLGREDVIESISEQGSSQAQLFIACCFEVLSKINKLIKCKDLPSEILFYVLELKEIMVEVTQRYKCRGKDLHECYINLWSLYETVIAPYRI